MLERKKAIVAIGGGGICGNQVAEIVGEEREIFNRNFGNQVAKKGEKKNYGNKVAKIVGEEREKFNRNFGNKVAENGEKRKEEEMWQWICQKLESGAFA